MTVLYMIGCLLGLATAGATMATVFLSANSTLSLTPTWWTTAGGSTPATAPGASDVADLNGHFLNVNQDWTVGTVTGTSGTGAGTLVIGAGTTRTLTGVIQCGSSSPFVSIGSTGTIVTITGDIIGPNTNSAIGISGFAGSLTVNGNLRGTTAGNPGRTTVIGINNSTTTNKITINGTLTASSSTAGSGINGDYLITAGGASNPIWGGQIIINGDVLGHGSGNSGAFFLSGASCSGSMLINGSVISGNAGKMVDAEGGSMYGTITGSCQGGTLAASYGLYHLLSSGVWHVGNAVGNAFGNGSVGFGAAEGVYSGQTCQTWCTTLTFGSRGMCPVNGNIFLENNTNATMNGITTFGGGSSLSLTNPAASITLNAADVRYGTTIAPLSVTGTLRVPSPSSVAFGIQTDNTTGTAVLTVANAEAAVWDAATTGHQVAGSFGRILRLIARALGVV